MTYYLGMEVSSDNQGIHLNQKEYIKEFINSFGMENAHPNSTLLDSGFKMDNDPDSEVFKEEYQQGTAKL